MDSSPAAHYTGRRGFKSKERDSTMFTTEDKTIAPTIDGGIASAAGISTKPVTTASIGTTTTTAPASRPVANMDETDWTTMLMEMRILSA